MSLRKIMNVKTGLIIGALLMSNLVFAEGTSLGEISDAARRSGDKSREALVSIFGNVVNNPLATGGSGGGDTILASVFQVINSALLVVAGLFACYIFYKRIAQTAYDGSVFDREKNAMWTPIRLLWGIASLVPTANGWCLAQLLMLWAASLLGVGIANLSADASLEALNSGKSMVAQPVMPSTLDLARNVFEINLCMHGINAGLSIADRSGALIPSEGYIQQEPTNSGFVLKNESFVCGGADINTDFSKQAKSTNMFSGSIDISDIRRAHLEGLKAIQASLSATAMNFVNALIQKQDGLGVQLPDTEIAIQSAAQQYENIIMSTASTKQGNIGELAAELQTSIKAGGWWTLGAWYQTYAQANTKLSDAVAAKASTYGSSSDGDPGMVSFLEMAKAAYKAQQTNNTGYAAPLGTSRSADYSMTATGNDAGKVIGNLFHAPGQRMVNYMVNMDLAAEGRGQINPLIKMKNLGDYITGIAETSLGLYVGAKVMDKVKSGNSVAGLGASVANRLFSIGDMYTGALEALSPFLIMMITSLFLIGVVMSVYLPMVPFVIWFGAAINWLVIVGEAIIAAPLWAIAHLGSEGEGMGSKTAHGYIFSLNLIARPALMVVGFFLGGAAIIAGGTFLNWGFGIALANAQFDSVTGLLSIIGFLCLYASMCLTLVHNSFNLIFIVPDQVINWVGGTAASHLGRDDNDRVKNAINLISNKIEGMVPRRNKA